MLTVLPLQGKTVTFIIIGTSFQNKFISTSSGAGQASELECNLWAVTTHTVHWTPGCYKEQGSRMALLASEYVKEARGEGSVPGPIGCWRRHANVNAGNARWIHCSTGTNLVPCGNNRSIVKQYLLVFFRNEVSSSQTQTHAVSCVDTEMISL